MSKSLLVAATLFLVVLCTENLDAMPNPVLPEDELLNKLKTMEAEDPMIMKMFEMWKKFKVDHREWNFEANRFHEFVLIND